MSELLEALETIRGQLDAHKVRWALVGGLGVAVRAEPRQTRDVDIVVQVAGDSQAEQLIQKLRAVGFRERPDTLLIQKAQDRIAAVRLDSPEALGGVTVDLLFASSGIEPEIVEASQELVLADGLRVPVARTGHLIALKVLAGRPLDLGDVRNLLDSADERERELAWRSLELIERRGFHRGKDLGATFAELLKP